MKQRRPYKKGIATSNRFRLTGNSRNKEDLIKKGLRPAIVSYCECHLRNKEDLIKKGLRPIPIGIMEFLDMKQRRPYKKGIATTEEPLFFPLFSVPKQRRPYEKGIKHAKLCQACECVLINYIRSGDGLVF